MPTLRRGFRSARFLVDQTDLPGMRNGRNFPLDERARFAPFGRAVDSVRRRLRRSALLLRRRVLRSSPLVAPSFGLFSADVVSPKTRPSVAYSIAYSINVKNAASNRFEAAFFLFLRAERSAANVRVIRFNLRRRLRASFPRNRRTRSSAPGRVCRVRRRRSTARSNTPT